MSEQFQDGLTSYERSLKAERSLCEAIHEAIETRMEYDIAPRMVDTEYALEEATEWIEILMKRQVRASRDTLWRSRVKPSRDRARARARAQVEALNQRLTEVAQGEFRNDEPTP